MTDDARELIRKAEEARERFAAVLEAAGLDQDRLGAAAERMRSRLPASRIRKAEQQVAELLEPTEAARRPAGSSELVIPMGIRA